MRQLLFLLTLLLGLFQINEIKRGRGKPRQRGEGARSFFIEYLDIEDLDYFKSIGAGNISAGIRLCAKIARAEVTLVCPVHLEYRLRASYADLYVVRGVFQCAECGTRLVDRAALEVIDARVGAVTSARQDVPDARVPDAPDARAVDAPPDARKLSKSQDARDSQDAREKSSPDARVKRPRRTA